MKTRITIINLLAFTLFAGITSVIGQVSLKIESPSSLLGNFQGGYADFGPVVSNVTLNSDIVYLQGVDSLGCDPISIDLAGKIAMIDRGTCDFSTKVYNAQLAGATGVVIALEVGRELLFVIPGGANASLVTIPVMSLVESDYTAIKQVLISTPVVATIINIDEFAQSQVVFEERFDQGLNGWTSNVLEQPDSVWTWGPFGESQATIFHVNSPSAQSNGAAIFDASYYNRDFIGEPNPYPFYTVALESPNIDVSLYETLYLTFYQSNWRLNARNRPIPQTYLQYSINGGAEWSTLIEIETENDLNDQITGFPHSEAVQIVLENLNFTENLKIRFVYDGDFYFWGIDDIRLVLPPDDELVIDNAFYPLIHYATAAHHLPSDTLGFSLNIFNGGLNDALGSQILVKITDDNGDPHYEQEELIDLNAFERAFFTFPELHSAQLLPGNYNLIYSISNPNAVDAFPDNNLMSFPFVVTDQLFAQELAPQEVILRTFSNLTAPYYWGGFFTLGEGDLRDCMYMNLQTAVSATDGTLDDEELAVYILKWSDDNDNYPNYGDELLQANVSPLAHPNLTIEAVSLLSFDGVGQNELIDFSLENGDWFNGFGEAITKLAFEKNTTYAVVGQFVDQSIALAGVNTENLAGTPTILYEESSGSWSPGIVDDFVPILRSTIDCIVATDPEPFQAAEVKIYPNLAIDEFSIDFNLIESSDVTVRITDMQGRILRSLQLEDIHRHKHVQSVNRLSNGTYIVHVTSDTKKMSKKLIIAH